MKVYLDNCCYNRLFDDRTIIKNYLEREAVLLIMEKAFEHELEIIGSQALVVEIMNNKNIQRRNDIIGLYNGIVSKEEIVDDCIQQRAEVIRNASNIRLFDSVHLAVAEQSADVLITTDAKFLNACKRLKLDIKVENPIEFIILMEGDNDDGYN